MKQDEKAGVALADADLWALMNANRGGIARLIAKAHAAEPETPAAAPDVALAAKHKAAILAALEPVLAALNAARVDGYEAAFGLGPDADGKSIVRQFAISKTYAV